LELIQVLVSAGRKEKAREKLQDLIDTYPLTEAAKKAKEMLIELKK
jgi:TolA-binding protein